jgi:SAM-dependent methyltransferase
VADAEDLPFENGSFDVVLSTFGVMFTPDQERSAHEMLRVTRRGGRIGMANWTPEGFIGELFRVISAHFAPPPGVKPASLWGREPRIVELFGPAAANISCIRRNYNFRYLSAAHWIDVFRTCYGPMLKVYSALAPDKQARLTADITAVLERRNTDGPKSLVIPGEYLEVVVTL